MQTNHLQRVICIYILLFTQGCVSRHLIYNRANWRQGCCNCWDMKWSSAYSRDVFTEEMLVCQQTRHRSWYLAVRNTFVFFQSKLSRDSCGGGDGGQNLDWKDTEVERRQVNKAWKPRARRQKKPEAERQKNHNAKRQRTEGHCQHMAQRSSWLLCNAWLFSWKWWQPMNMHHSAHGFRPSYFRGQAVTRRAWHVWLHLHNLNDTP